MCLEEGQFWKRVKGTNEGRKDLPGGPWVRRKLYILTIK